jgi:hypothetical protein
MTNNKNKNAIFVLFIKLKSLLIDVYDKGSLLIESYLFFILGLSYYGSFYCYC